MLSSVVSLVWFVKSALPSSRRLVCCVNRWPLLPACLLVQELLTVYHGFSLVWFVKAALPSPCLRIFACLVCEVRSAVPPSPRLLCLLVREQVLAPGPVPADLEHVRAGGIPGPPAPRLSDRHVRHEGEWVKLVPCRDALLAYVRPLAGNQQVNYSVHNVRVLP